MRNLTVRIISIPALLLVLLAACNMPQTAAPTNELEVIVASTRTALAVSQFLTATNRPAELPATSTLAAAQLSPSPFQTEPAIQLTQVGPPTSAPTQAAAQPTVQLNCSYAAKFEGETIPDGSAFNSGQEFQKTWRLRNVGTCTWRPETSLVFVRGEQMDGSSPLLLGQSVAPNNTIQVPVTLRAPAAAGQYQGYWKLHSPEGVEFGLGANADVAFWVKIQVVQDSGSATTSAPFGGPQDLGSPDRTISFEDGKSPWYLGTDEGIDYDIKNGRLIVTASKPTGDLWRVANLVYLDDFFVQVDFKTGPACGGKDGYGLLVRAPDKASGIINSGYVFSFSCDGKYRVYRMDSGAYFGIQNWTSSPALLAGTNQSNMMGIYLLGDKIQLFANGILIFQFSDDTYSEGLLGMMIRSEATINFLTAVEEVAIWNIP